MDDWFQSHIQQGGFLGILALCLYTLVRWLFKREVERWEKDREAEKKRVDDHESRLRDVESDRVTKENFDELRESMMATYTNAHQMLERRIDETRKDIREDISWIKNFLIGRKP